MTLASESPRRRPSLDWTLAILALIAVTSPYLAATGATLNLSTGPFLLAGILGLPLALLLGRRVRPMATAAPRRLPAAARITILLLWAVGLALLLLAIGQALPEPGLVTADIAAWWGWAAATLGRPPETPAPEPPAAIMSAELFRIALARFGAELVAAPTAGERGAALMIAALGTGLTWTGALLLGWGLIARRSLLPWSLPLLVALGLTAILGGAGGGPLIGGLAALLVLVAGAGLRQHEAAWGQAAIDYSDEIFRDVVAWGALLSGAAILAAWLLPLWPGNPLAQALLRDDDTPSALAVLERHIQRPRPGGGSGEIGLPVFAELSLGSSVAQGPPEQPALRVQVAGPLPGGELPRYWRARIFNRYTSDGWASGARITPETDVPFPEVVPEGMILQEISDLRSNREVAVGQADVVFLDGPASGERLRDGALTALLPDPPRASYRVLSRLPEDAPALVQQPNAPAPDLGPYLGLPRSLPARVRDLAQAVAGEEPDALRRGLAIERYLRNLPYTYVVEPVPAEGDGVDQFLFEMRSGYCTYYASAMAVMARTLGIPSRLAIGYATGEYDAETGSYLVREADAHAWPELLIDGRWIPFEPTPVRPLPARGGRPEPAAPTSQPAEDVARDRVTGPLIWLGVLAAVALLTAGGFVAARWRPRHEPLVAQAQRALERYGTRAGLAWGPATTLQEYGRLLAARAGPRAAAVGDLVVLVELARYGGRDLDGAEQRRLVEAAARLQ